VIVEVLEDGIVERGILSFDRLRYYYSYQLQLLRVALGVHFHSFRHSSLFLLLLTPII